MWPAAPVTAMRIGFFINSFEFQGQNMASPPAGSKRQQKEPLLPYFKTTFPSVTYCGAGLRSRNTWPESIFGSNGSPFPLTAATFLSLFKGISRLTACGSPSVQAASFFRAARTRGPALQWKIQDARWVAAMPSPREQAKQARKEREQAEDRKWREERIAALDVEL